MKIKRMRAANIREAMRKVRDELGADAVILSNRRTSDGFEIVAAIDYDEKLLEDPATTPAMALEFSSSGLNTEHREISESPPGTGTIASLAAVPSDDPSEPDTGESLETETETISITTGPATLETALAPAEPLLEPVAAEPPPDPSTAQPAPDPATTESSPEPGQAELPPAPSPQALPDHDQQASSWAQEPLLVDIQNDIKYLHRLMEQQLSGFAWGEMARHQPHCIDLLSRLMNFGLTSELCMQLADACNNVRGSEQAWQKSLANLTHGIRVTDDDILTQGGVVALIGPTGVGKTTTVAKLAARYTLRHGPRRLALLTTDSYRIGAFDQLRTFGMILDIPVRLTSTPEELRDAIASFADKSLILIDTAGMSQRDLRLSQQFSLLSDTPTVKNYLVLAANAQASMLEETVVGFGKLPLTATILTKVDEATRLGGILSIIYDRQLAVAYVSNGQRVPEDLQIGRADALVAMGAEYMERYGNAAENEPLALTLGRRIANAGL